MAVRVDGSIVSVTCDNATELGQPGGPGSFGIESTSYTGNLPPLTVEQVTALALDPTLTMYP
jgi:hypothetical protein